ncbi:CU044_2847 family protein [Methylocapsa palsarum]|uniref:Trypsin-co-occurring domain-containing protein n=1 Tax=Methylocapsa palsarum TaxID=1612308 RepID=A0A1I3WTP5_9HYPH|nr:CU044_2847 family protein [Methylocapsa palsarum]SFK11014.1 hypothetical protein SAMN05444581_102146 [Methylocapsa palsarum]
MSARMLVELADGNIILFGGGPVTGAPDVGLSDDFSRSTAETFQAAFASLGLVAKMFEDSISALPNGPGKLELEFGATLSRDCDLWIVPAGGPAEFKVKLTWEKG